MIFLTFAVPSVQASTNVYEGTYYYTTKTGIWPFRTTHTWYSNSYRVDDTVVTIATLKYMGSSFYWDGGTNYPSASISMSVGVTVAATISYTLSASLGLEIPINAALLVPQIGISESYSVTVSSTISNLYTVNLTTASPAGYYTFEARMNMEEYKEMTYETTSGSAVYNSTGYTFVYLANTPYYYCAFTTFQVN